jgi:hypothetical protein
MKFGISLLAILVLFMLTGVIPVNSGAQTVIFRTPVFIILLILLGVSLLVCSFKKKLKFRNIAFHLIHLGAVLILIGAGITYMKEVKFSFMLPVNEEFIVREVPLEGGEVIDFGFGLALKNFKPVDNQYTAALSFITDNDSAVERKMATNKPVNFNKWLFYLSSYDPQSFSYIIVTARRDPGRKIAITGMLALFIGVTMTFWGGNRLYGRSQE